MKIIPRKFILAYIVITFLATVTTAWLFIFASNDLAAKSCLKVGYALQNQYKKDHGHFASQVGQLGLETMKSGIDDSCLIRFQLNVATSSENEFEMQASLKGKILKINQARVIFE